MCARCRRIHWHKGTQRNCCTSVLRALSTKTRPYRLYSLLVTPLFVLTRYQDHHRWHLVQLVRASCWSHSFWLWVSFKSLAALPTIVWSRPNSVIPCGPSSYRAFVSCPWSWMILSSRVLWEICAWAGGVPSLWSFLWPFLISGVCPLDLSSFWLLPLALSRLYDLSLWPCLSSVISPFGLVGFLCWNMTI